MPPDPADGPDDAGTAVLSCRPRPDRGWPGSRRRSSASSRCSCTYGRCCPASRSGTGARCRPSRTCSGWPTRRATRRTSCWRWLAQLVPIGSVAFRPNLLSAVLVRGPGDGLRDRHAGVRPCWPLPGRSPWARSATSGRRPPSPRSTRSIYSCAHCSSIGPSSGRTRRRPIDLVIGGLLVGLALGNHLLTLFVAPFVAVFVALGRAARAARAAVDRRARPRWPSWPDCRSMPTSRSRRARRRRSRTTTRRRSTGSGGWSAGASSGTSSTSSQRRAPGCSSSRSALCATSRWPGRRRSSRSLGLIGIGILLVRRTAFGLLCVAIIVSGAYVWSNYLRLEHYLLVPWLIIAIGATVALGVDRSWRDPDRPAARPDRPAPRARGRRRRRPDRARSRAGPGRAELHCRRSERRSSQAMPTSTRPSRRCRPTRRSCRTGMPPPRCGMPSSSRVAGRTSLSSMTRTSSTRAGELARRGSRRSSASDPCTSSGSTRATCRR